MLLPSHPQIPFYAEQVNNVCSQHISSTLYYNFFPVQYDRKIEEAFKLGRKKETVYSPISRQEMKNPKESVRQLLELT